MSIILPEYNCVFIFAYTIYMCVLLGSTFHIPFKVCLFVLMLPALPTADIDNTVDSITFA